MVQLFTALLLGLLTILDPCTLMTSITAIGYIDKEINNKKLVLTNGLMFVLGKLATYVLLSIPFLAGAQTDGIQHLLAHWGEPILAGFMLICGVVLLFSGHHHHEHDHGISKWLKDTDSKESWIWSFILGIFFAIAFCPHRLVYFLTMMFRNRCAYYADCMVSKLQRGKYRQPHEQDGSIREMVPTYMRSVVPHFGRISRYPLLYRGARPRSLLRTPL